MQPEAEQDLDEIYQFLESRLSGLGFDFLADLSNVFELLEENPFIFQKIYADKRRALIQRFGVSVIYKITGNIVYLLAVIHNSRNPDTWKIR